MGVLNDEQKKFYEETLKHVKNEIADIDNQIEEELARVKQKLAELQKAKKAALQVYAGACARLGIENDLAGEEESEEFEG
ncbi:hypothetical protein TTHT_0512 [Thermotomaculum hydrothermale]|uniref:Uncharacterized protein n=1 Tax=Thermotomaculum hydrothermale TaxID=981385 RepID=A0A7R6SYR5_9BACT|nr:hypothetical protein [Thermotomaculum hydrothermale]BBB32100.1 hypothetical protein TTHT_0512 [Thermotomaculum hydrothermale]